MSVAALPGEVIPLAAVAGLVLAGMAVSFLTLWRAKALLRAGARQRPEALPLPDPAVEALQHGLEALQAQVHDMRQYAPAAAVPPPPRAGLNLDKRSQALRMHRRGEAPAEIAAVLELPLQEVELLLKVHRIVLRSI